MRLVIFLPPPPKPSPPGPSPKHRTQPLMGRPFARSTKSRGVQVPVMSITSTVLMRMGPARPAMSGEGSQHQQRAQHPSPACKRKNRNEESPHVYPAHKQSLTYAEAIITPGCSQLAPTCLRQWAAQNQLLLFCRARPFGTPPVLLLLTFEAKQQSPFPHCTRSTQPTGAWILTRCSSTCHTRIITCPLTHKNQKRGHLLYLHMSI